MVRLSQDAQGHMRVNDTQKLEEKYGPIPGAVLQLAFDAATNSGRLVHLRANRNHYALDTGPPVRLLLDGVPVVLNTPGPLMLIRAKVFNGLPLNDAERNVLDRLLFRLLADARED